VRLVQNSRNSVACADRKDKPGSPVSVLSTPRFMPSGMPAMPKTSMSKEPRPGLANGTLQHTRFCMARHELHNHSIQDTSCGQGGEHARAEVDLVHLRRVDLQSCRRVHLALAVRATPVLLLQMAAP